MTHMLIAPIAAMLAAAAAPGTVKVADLGWLAGVWVTEEELGWTEERWAPPRGGVMLGTNLSGRPDGARGYEFMRIQADKQGRVNFYASPNGLPPSAFPVVSSSRSEVVFENIAHDYPTRIVYRREGQTLVATISGRNGRNPQTWRFKRPR